MAGPGTGWDVEEKGLLGAPPIRVVVGEEVHISVKALSMWAFVLDWGSRLSLTIIPYGLTAVFRAARCAVPRTILLKSRTKSSVRATETPTRLQKTDVFMMTATRW